LWLSKSFSVSQSCTNSSRATLSTFPPFGATFGSAPCPQSLHVKGPGGELPTLSFIDYEPDLLNLFYLHCSLKMYISAKREGHLPKYASKNPDINVEAHIYCIKSFY